jgi:O-antigen ligase
MATLHNPVRQPVLARPQGRGRNSLWLALGALFTVGALAAFYELSSGQAISIILLGSAFFILMAFVVSASSTAELRTRNVVFALWWVLLGSEEVFSYVTEDAEGGQISSGAYSEAMIWVFVTLVFLLYTYRHHRYLSTLFAGPYKWLSWFGLLCLASCAYAEQPAFSLAWIIKLFLAILLLAACNSEIKDASDLRAFLTVSQWGCAFLIVVPVIRLLANPEILASGRIYDVGSAPTMLSVDAGLLVLFSLALYRPGKRLSLYIFTTLGTLIMLLSAGKAGILGCIFAGSVFFLLRGRFKAAARFLLILTVVGTVLVVFTPVGSYLKYYFGSQQAGSFTGRTDVWAAGWELIKAKMFLGRGFMSSRFLAYKVSIPWQPGHLHNGFLEVWYNNGLVGLALILAMHYWIIRNLVRVLRTVSLDDPLHILAAGCFAIYLDILINGLVSRTFGSRPDATFMLLFALIFVADRLRQAASAKRVVRPVPAWQSTPLPAL